MKKRTWCSQIWSGNKWAPDYVRASGPLTSLWFLLSEMGRPWSIVSKEGTKMSFSYFKKVILGNLLSVRKVVRSGLIVDAF